MLSIKITVMDEFVKESNLPRKFKYMIRRALEYSSLKSIFSPDDKNEFLQLIPVDLKFEVWRKNTLKSGKIKQNI